MENYVTQRDVLGKTLLEIRLPRDKAINAVYSHKEYTELATIRNYVKKGEEVPVILHIGDDNAAFCITPKNSNYISVTALGNSAQIEVTTFDVTIRYQIQEGRSEYFADAYRIGDNICFVTGRGKTVVGLSATGTELVANMVELFTINKESFVHGTFFGGTMEKHKLHYCIHMLSPNESQISEIQEVPLETYIKYASKWLCYGSQTERFVQTITGSDVKFILVPWYENAAKRGLQLRKYLKQ